MLGTPSRPFRVGQSRRAGKGTWRRDPGTEPCQGTLGEAFLEGGASALMHFCFLNLSVGYTTGGLGWLAFNKPK